MGLEADESEEEGLPQPEHTELLWEGMSTGVGMGVTVMVAGSLPDPKEVMLLPPLRTSSQISGSWLKRMTMTTPTRRKTRRAAGGIWSR